MPLPPSVPAHFELLGPLGSGGMGEVFKAQWQRLWLMGLSRSALFRRLRSAARFSV